MAEKAVKKADKKRENASQGVGEETAQPDTVESMLPASQAGSGIRPPTQVLVGPNAYGDAPPERQSKGVDAATEFANPCETDPPAIDSTLATPTPEITSLLIRKIAEANKLDASSSGHRAGGAQSSDASAPKRKRRLIKHCFMTGKQCIFSSQIAEDASSDINKDNLGLFVVMPFGPNLKTFYEWCLKPCLMHDYGLPEETIHRADEVREIGYIVCEKICRQIQESDLVLVDVSLRNSNVFYEIGLAYGLERPVVLMRNSDTPDRVLCDSRIRQCLNLDNQPGEADLVLEYNGVRPLNPRDIEGHQLHKYVRPTAVSRSMAKRLDITVLVTSEIGEHAGQQRRNDIHLNLTDVMRGAVTVAMTEIRQNVAPTEKRDESTYGACGTTSARHNGKQDPWRKIVASLVARDGGNRRSDWDEFSEANVVYANGIGGFGAIAERLQSSFCTIIDVSGSDPVAYFWLGYCHARGLTAIPVFRNVVEPDEKARTPWCPAYGVRAAQQAASQASGNGNGSGSGDSQAGASAKPPATDAAQADDAGVDPVTKLAFDIRALWYAEYDDSQPYIFKTKIRETLEHLLARDLPDRQKRAFWDRFPQESKLKLFTGAIHSDDLKREMIGDWDLRTASELLAYLPSVREATQLEFVPPLHSPDEVYRSKGDIDKNEFLKKYCSALQDHLRGCNAIVIASSDVNPVTEFLLHKLYEVRNTEPFHDFGEPQDKTLPVFWEEADFDGYVLMKRLEREPSEFKRLFCRNRDIAPTQPPKDGMDPKEMLRRGFAMHHRRSVDMTEEQLFSQYVPQSGQEAPFWLLGHLVVARNPFSTQNIVVILNGVSGPATFGLAQMLTGGRGMQQEEEREQNGRSRAQDEDDRNTLSEQWLEMINLALDRELGNSDSGGIEAIVGVKVVSAAAGAERDYTRRTSLDKREVTKWEFVHPPAAVRKRQVISGLQSATPRSDS